jgi:hypothetical protein
MRRLPVLLALILMPVAAGAADFKCDEVAFDLAACTDPADLSTCPSVCVDSNDPLTCAVLPLPELPVLARQLAAQPILRQVTVLEGPYTDVMLSRVALSAAADAIFKAARDRLCVPPPPPPPPASGQGTPPGGGSGFIGGNPGLIGGNPGLIGGSPGIVGGNPGFR